MSGETHLGERLLDLVDGRAPAGERAQAEEHLAACALCRRELEALSRAQAAARGLRAEPVPEALAAALAAALDREADRSPGAAAARRPGWLRPALAFGLVLLAAAAALWWRGDLSRQALPAAVAQDYAAFGRGGLPLEFQTQDGPELERLFAAGGIDFDTRVFDLAMMGYRVAGGRVHTLRGRPSALFVYEGEQGRRLLCQMYRGRLAELPPPDAVREHDGIVFQVYRREGITLVFWQEGEVVCVLASSIPAEDVVQLAFAKAMKVASAGLALFLMLAAAAAGR